MTTAIIIIIIIKSQKINQEALSSVAQLVGCLSAKQKVAKAKGQGTCLVAGSIPGSQVGVRTRGN